MNLRLQWHYQPDGAWQLTVAEYCGTVAPNGVMTARDIVHVTCIKCRKKYDKIRKQLN